MEIGCIAISFTRSRTYGVYEGSDIEITEDREQCIQEDTGSEERSDDCYNARRDRGIAHGE